MISFSNKIVLSKFLKLRLGNVVCLFLITLTLSIAFSFTAFAAPYTLCTGKEFNQRVKAFLNGNDRKATIDNTITTFQKGNNPPDDPAYFVDVSEDRDGSIIVYTVENDINDKKKKNNSTTDYNYTLYWYSDGIASMNPNAAFMFDKFVRIRTIDLSGFVYLNGLTDTRYMFLECRNLKNLKFKKDNSGKEFMPSEMQGMFCGCQSLTNIDLTLFNTKMVDNMTELFFRCYNLKNIYVDTSRWNVENVMLFNRMFSDCHMLRSNDGRKAVDVDEDDYGDFAVPGDDNKEGFIKDINYQYDDYGEYLGSVPIDGANYLMVELETTQAYADEPEYDGETGKGIGDGVTPYIGDSASGYNAQKPTQPPASVINPTAAPDAVNRSIEITENSAEQVKLPESSIVPAETSETVVETSVEINDNETSGRRIIELDEYLKEQNQEGQEGQGEFLGGIFKEYKFLIMALVISIIVILLLVGMVAYLTKSNRENKDKDSHTI
jgi:surface protein